MSFIMCRVKAERGFHDGNVYRTLEPREIVVVDEDTYKRMKKSDPESIVLIEKLVPNPKKKRDE